MFYSSLWPLRDTTVVYLCWEGVICTIQEFHLLCRNGPGSSVMPCIHSFPYSNSNYSWAQSLGQHIPHQRAHRQHVAAQISGEWRQTVLTGRLSPPFSSKWEPHFLLASAVWYLNPETLPFTSIGPLYLAQYLPPLKLLSSKWIVILWSNKVVHSAK